MRVNIKILVVLFFTTTNLFSQLNLKVILIDKNKAPVPFATISYDKFIFNSNKNGFLKINNYKLGNKIYIKRLGFNDTTVILTVVKNSNDTIRFLLQQKIELLNEIPVYSNIIEEINPTKANFILDFELDEDNLIELGSLGIINLINNQNQLINTTKPYSKAEKISKDPFGNIYLITPDFVYKTQINNLLIKVDSIPLPRNKFDWAITYCDAVCDSFYFIRRYKDLNQTIEFFAITTKSTKFLRSIPNEERVEAVKANSIKVYRLIREVAFLNETNLSAETGDLSAKELELRRKIERMSWTNDQIYLLPSYNILRSINDSIYIFAHDIDTMFVYDKTCKLIKRQYIDYHHLRSWGKNLIVNEEKTKVFALLKTNENIMITEINLTTGLIKPPFLKIESVFPPKKIKIRGNKIYFMTKQHDGVGYTLFSQNIE